MKRSVIFPLGAALLLAGLAFGQDKDKPKKPDGAFDLEAYAKFGEPGPQHKQLEPLVGNWTYKVKLYMDPSKPPMEMTGKSERKWILGGRFIQETIHGDEKERPFAGLGLVGYDNIQKKFTMAWLDNMSSSIMTSTGTADAAGKTFTYTGEHFDPVMGKTVKTRDVMVLDNNDQHHTVMYRVMDGKDVKAMEITFTRVKK